MRVFATFNFFNSIQLISDPVALPPPLQRRNAGAVALIKGSTNVSGSVIFQPNTGADQCLKITIQLQNLSPGEKTISIHEFGDTRSGCEFTGSPYEPRDFFVADGLLLRTTLLGTENGVRFTKCFQYYSSPSYLSVLGRGVVVTDVGTGQRLGCGVVGRAYYKPTS